MPKHPTPHSPTKGQTRRLQEFHALGQEAFSQSEASSGTYSPGTIATLAKEHRCSRDHVEKARRLAAEYTRPELRELCESGLTRSHTMLLIFVKDKRKRKSLQRIAAKEGWSSRQLQREIRGRVGERTGHGGRKPIPPRNLTQAENQIRERCGQWLRWSEMILDGDESVELPRAVAKRLRSASAAIRRLKAVVDA